MKQLKLFDKSDIKIPIRHLNDTRYKKHCVDCGILVREYGEDYDGIRCCIGDIINERLHRQVFGGFRCEECYKKLEDWIKEYYYEQN